MGENVDKQTDGPDRDYVHDDPVVDAALDWFGRLREAPGDAALQAAFRHWLAQDPRHEHEFRALETAWGSTAFLKAVKALPPSLPAELATEARRGAGRWSRRIAAAAAIAALAVGIWQYPGLMLRWRADYLTAAGDQSTVTLPDGSTMILNTDTGVAIDFQDGRRDIVLLQGEAWFDVRHDPAHPFRVTGGFGQAVVKGTSFAVRRQADRDEIVLERGRVDVTCLCQQEDRVELRPGQAVAVTDTGPLAAAAVDSGRRLSWRDGRIAFEEVRLGDVVDELARYYHGRIFVSGDRIGRLVVTGHYRLDNIEGAIRTLADAAGVTMIRVPGGLIILR